MTFENIVILAAGKGSRFHELGKQYPKCCLPYKEKPIIVHLLEQAQERTENIRIAYMHESQKEMIMGVVSFYDHINMDKISFVQIHTNLEAYGPAESLGQALPDAGSALVLLSDYVVDMSCIGEPLGSNQVYVMQVEGDYSRWCMVDRETGKFYDKPKEIPPTDFAAAGIYFIEDSYLYKARLEEYKSDSWNGEEIQFSSVFEQMMDSKFTFPYISKSNIIDMGTLSEYLFNKGVRKERAFNDVEIINKPNNTKLVKKSSSDFSKLMKEATFIKHLPEQFSYYYPTIHEINATSSFYTMDFVPHNNLRELFLFLDRSYATWFKVFSKVREYIDQCSKFSKLENGCFWKANTLKGLNRIDHKFFEFKNPGVEPDTFLKGLESRLIQEFGVTNTMFHGDLHFANMFYDFTLDRTQFVDPRGDFMGHWFYDLAKLYHSVFGRYDFIDLQLYSTNGEDGYFYDQGCEEVRRAFNEVFSDLIKGRETLLQDLTASLFLTMIPLHQHSYRNMELFYQEYLRLSSYSENNN